MPSPALNKLEALPKSPFSSSPPSSPPNSSVFETFMSATATQTITATDSGRLQDKRFLNTQLDKFQSDKQFSPISPSDIGVGKLPHWSAPRPAPIHTTSTTTTTGLSQIESAKRLAAHMAVDKHLKPSHKVVGIGSGSTVPYVVERILELGGNENRWFIPTGFQSKELIVSAGLKLGDVDQFPTIDLTIDGADEVDAELNAIKGGGACHLREKVLAEAAKEFVIVADYRKNSEILGDNWKNGIPIEVAPFAYSKVLGNIAIIPGSMKPVLRMGKAKAGPVVTDNGNFVIDAVFDEAHMREPDTLFHKLKMLTGVVEVGLFCGMARAAYFGNEDGSVTTKWDDGRVQTHKNVK